MLQKVLVIRWRWVLTGGYSYWDSTVTQQANLIVNNLEIDQLFLSTTFIFPFDSVNSMSQFPIALNLSDNQFQLDVNTQFHFGAGLNKACTIFVHKHPKTTYHGSANWTEDNVAIIWQITCIYKRRYLGCPVMSMH